MKSAEQPLDYSQLGSEENLDEASASPALVREQYRSLTLLVPIIFSMVIVTTLLLSIPMRTDTSAILTSLIQVVVCGICLFRLIHWLKARNSADTQTLEYMQRELRNVGVFGPILALTFSVIGTAFIWHDGSPVATLAAVVIWIAAVLSAFCLFALPRAAMAVLVAATLPLLAGFFLSAVRPTLPFGILMLVFSGVVAYLLQQSYRIFIDNIRARIQLGKNVEDLEERVRQRTLELEARSQRLLEGIVENVPLVVFVKRASDLRLVLVNHTAEEVFGYPRSTLLGAGNYDLWPPKQGDEFTAADRKVLASKEVIKIDAEPVMTSTGETRYLDTWKAPLYDENGNPEYLLGIALDVTDKKNSDERLRQAQKLEAVGQMTAGVAHDFNNLLTVILANLELMDPAAQGMPQLKKRIEAAMEATERGAKLTQHLLSFSRKQALSPRKIDLSAEVQEVTFLLRRTIPESIAIEVAVAPEPVWVLVDKDQLGNAIINLAINARDAMKAGGVLLISVGIEEQITAETEAGADAEVFAPGRYGVITVRDTGAGMSPEVLARAFDPFFTTKETGQGSGLGLSMVYGFMRQSNGRANLSSSATEGTTVKLIFPLADGETREAVHSQSKLLTQSTAQQHRVLVVDDMPDVREVTAYQLSSLGLDVSTASDGPGALKILEDSDHFDLLVTDVGLPGGMNGLELAMAVAARFPAIKVVTMSGYNDKQVSSSLDRPPEWKHLQKPFKRTLLAELIQELFEKN